MEPFLRKKFRLKKRYASGSPVKTAAVAALLAKCMEPGQVAGLSGGLGAGKTHFIKGAAMKFGFRKKDITSPTFGLVREHRKGRVLFYHFDLYRLKTADELEKIGYRDYISDPEAVTFIEWPGRIKGIWKDCDWWVEIKIINKNKRMIYIYRKVISHKS